MAGRTGFVYIVDGVVTIRFGVLRGEIVLVCGAAAFLS